jgi:hypothetical protein
MLLCTLSCNEMWLQPFDQDSLTPAVCYVMAFMASFLIGLVRSPRVTRRRSRDGSELIQRTVLQTVRVLRMHVPLQV